MNTKHFPVPYLEIDQDFHIRAMSGPASSLFSQARSLKELLDEVSMNKAVKFISPSHSNMRVELNLKTQSQPLALFEVYQRWDSQGIGHLVCISQQKKIEVVSDKLHQLHENLKRGTAGGTALSPVVPFESASCSGNPDVRNALENIKALVEILRPSLIEFGKGDYADIIIHQVHAAMGGIASYEGRRQPVRE